MMRNDAGSKSGLRVTFEPFCPYVLDLPTLIHPRE
jgi:hypothetical protein